MSSTKLATNPHNADLIEQLFHQQRYGEAVDFVLPHLGFLERAKTASSRTKNQKISLPASTSRS